MVCKFWSRFEILPGNLSVLNQLVFISKLTVNRQMVTKIEEEVGLIIWRFVDGWVKER